MDIIGFLCVSLGSSTVHLYDSLGSRRTSACSEAGFYSQNGDFFAAGFDTLVKQWDKCVSVGGGYIFTATLPFCSIGLTLCGPHCSAPLIAGTLLQALPVGRHLLSPLPRFVTVPHLLLLLITASSQFTWWITYSAFSCSSLL
jgi:hypothetical protein